MYVVGSENNFISETVLLGTEKMFILVDKEFITKYAYLDL